MDNQPQQKTDRQLLEEIHKFSRQTKNYMMWQMIITIALVVIPLIGAIALIPIMMKTIGSAYGISGSSINLNPNSAGDIVNQLKTLNQ